MKFKKQALFLFTLALVTIEAQACTIFSAKDKKGHVWVGNNEDNLFTFNSYLTLHVKTDSTIGFAFFTNSSGPEEYIQGGFNEAGLFYDGNSVPAAKYKDYAKKKDYPGGHRAMLQHMLGTCKTVPEVFALFEQYRIPGNETAQLHFADKYGNLGIIVADSMWITKADFQISTNYNLCHPDKDGITCWRYPIAERILKSREASFSTFRDICDSTSFKAVATTNYSNIHDLNSGEIWLYYGGDFTHVCKTSLITLLKRGNSSFPLHDLFTDSPLVQVFNTYEAKGLQAALVKMNSLHLSQHRASETGRCLYAQLVVRNHDFEACPLLTELMKSQTKPDELVQVTTALVLFCTDKKDQALTLLRTYLHDNPRGEMVELASIYLNQMQGIFDTEANTTFELPGYDTKKFVFVEGLDSPNFLYFLVPKEGKWTGAFKLDPGEYHYYFLADGKRILDANNPDRIQEQGKEFNRKIVK
ncbi:MAG TPA: hypothetical protein VNZ86_06155 [Bacteroidia bacterium]|jgi:hypothetical protein|nr:hypothetical protein [Bacteroidia bacterium]